MCVSIHADISYPFLATLSTKRITQTFKFTEKGRGGDRNRQFPIVLDEGTIMQRRIVLDQGPSYPGKL